MATFKFNCVDPKLTRGIQLCYSKWSNGSIHEKRRAKLLCDYISFIASPFDVADFESVASVYEFIDTHKNKTKWLMVGAGWQAKFREIND